jgi:DNA helicase-2/ATP-dependent DNA helicase PcrA
MAEERRLMYVAVTRARKELILTHADRHGNGAPRKASRFIGEVLEGAEATLHEEAAQTSLELYAPRTSPDSVPLPPEMHQDGQLILSVSQIDCWLRCPQDFYYRYVLQLPTPTEPQLLYGTLLHGVIEQLHRGRAAGTIPALEELTDHVIAHLPRAGYASAKSRERAHQQAVHSVAALYERFSTDELPIETEKPFGVAVPGLPLKIIGRIDAVYQRKNGVEIKDFKTGTSVTTEKKAKDRATGSQQLSLYALAWYLLHGELPQLLTLDFVETDQQGSVRKQQKSLDTLTNKLHTMVDEIQAGTYPPGRDHLFCSHPQ